MNAQHVVGFGLIATPLLVAFGMVLYALGIKDGCLVIGIAILGSAAISVGVKLLGA